LPHGKRPTIRAVAERLCVQHHTAVALVDKLEVAGLIERKRSQQDRREVLLRLTLPGVELLRKLSILHREKLRNSGAEMLAALGVVLGELGGSLCA
jgi:DNA-binding MarR family transcriptional regulator